MTGQANTFGLKATRAIVNDPDFHAELKTSKLTPVNDGRSVKFCKVTKKGHLRELLEVGGLAMNRDDALLVVVNEAKLLPLDKDIGDTVRKQLMLKGWLQRAAEQPDTFVTKPANVKDELAGIQWKIRLVLSGDNFTAEMEEECNAEEIIVVRSNGAPYGFSRPSSASSSSTEPAAPITSARRCAAVLAIGIAVVAPVATRRAVGGLSAAAARPRTAAAAPLPYMILLFVYDFAFVINEYRLLCQRVFVG